MNSLCEWEHEQTLVPSTVLAVTVVPCLIGFVVMVVLVLRANPLPIMLLMLCWAWNIRTMLADRMLVRKLMSLLARSTKSGPSKVLLLLCMVTRL